MVNRSITSANSVLVVTASSRGVANSLSGITGIDLGQFSSILGVPYELEGWAADRAFAVSAQTTSEIVLGVDGQAHFGWVPNLVQFDFSVMPDSDTAEFMETIYSIQQTLRETLEMNATLKIPALQRGYALINGALTNYTPLPAHHRVQAAQTFQMTFTKALPAPY
ncbi:phage tail fiber protein [Entomobacter blattae]|uniref:Tail tube protein n=1 Tax=Entomobacter blattae TaxID=2762277 RepID=A0A7H1NR70_9PROT|nr:hypothetical protein [Entomobacter blattae]QNT78280.1 hypothetical protein JGUZn3_10520 [Entomobacter blattae]